MHHEWEPMPTKAPDDSRVVSVRLPTPLVQRLDRLLDWHTTHRRRPTTRNAAMRDALQDWLDQQEQLAGLLDPQVLPQQFDAVLDALRAAQAIDLEALTEPAVDDPATHDRYHVHGQCYDRLRWRA